MKISQLGSAVLALLLSACGGGGGGSSESPPENIDYLALADVIGIWSSNVAQADGSSDLAYLVIDDSDGLSLFVYQPENSANATPACYALKSGATPIPLVDLGEGKFELVVYSDGSAIPLKVDLSLNDDGNTVSLSTVDLLDFDGDGNLLEISSFIGTRENTLKATDFQPLCSS